MIATEPIDRYLERLASREPTPGGGAAGAIHAAQAAALIGMVARFSTGTRYAAYSAVVEDVTARAEEHRQGALRLADADEDAFRAVIEAYRLPKGSEEESSRRTDAIQSSLALAATPPRRLVTVAGSVVALGERLAEFANPNVISDIAAAAEAARAAAATARVNIEINLAGLTRPDARDPLHESVAEADRVIRAADALSARVRRQILT